MNDLPELAFEWPRGAEPEELLTREWLVTNGLGGYASGTIAGCNTRRYHGLFIPSLPSPHGRTVMLPRLEEQVTCAGETCRLDGEETEGGALALPQKVLRRFALNGLVPHWSYEVGGARLSRRLSMIHDENTALIEYAHQGGPAITLTLRPFPAFRPHDRPIPQEVHMTEVRLRGARIAFHLREGAPELKLRLVSPRFAPFIAAPALSQRLHYRVEQRRGLDHHEQLESPGLFELRLKEGERAYLALSVEPWSELEQDLAPFFEVELDRERHLLEKASPHARTGLAARLVLAADQFIIVPSGRPADTAWARAGGQDARSVIAGYHWFTDWGRDTMISLEGLTLATGRHREAGAILRTFQHYVKDGLLPNMFPEGGREGLYHTADATLWFFHAIDRYLSTTGDDVLLRDIFDTLDGIVSAHVRGTHYGIRIDPTDGLMTQGQLGYQLTWMDAKVDDWVVTPRRGKAVELNALWFNAVRLMQDWAGRVGRDPAPYRTLADRAERSFNERFWNPEANCLFDIVDAEGGGNDPAIRPNQVFAISLHHPVLARERWKPVLSTIETELLTPLGLRTLHRGHGDYKQAYDGDLRARDAAYHQGTVWPWLLGHYLDAALKFHGNKRRIRELLSGLEEHLREAGLGQVSEIFDADPPHHPRGCIAQAWSVAEFLRVWLATHEH